MATIQIRDIPDEDAEVPHSRAAAAGMSLQAYMRQQLITPAAEGRDHGDGPRVPGARPGPRR